jgi:hypothetical protein
VEITLRDGALFRSNRQDCGTLWRGSVPSVNTQLRSRKQSPRNGQTEFEWIGAFRPLHGIDDDAFPSAPQGENLRCRLSLETPLGSLSDQIHGIDLVPIIDHSLVRLTAHPDDR